jgi:cytochrome P450
MKAIQERTARENEETEKQDNQSVKDYFYWLSRAVDSETKEGYKIEEIQAECALLMSAGSNGPAFVLAAAFFYLTRYPKVLDRLCSEIRTTFSSSKEIVTGPKMTECLYLRAVLEESLRMTPAIFGVLPRQVMAGGQVVDGIFLPEDTVLGTSAYAIHHNPEYFPDPDVFRPERWIADDTIGVTAESVQRAKSAFFAFSMGGSSCIGKQIAYQQMSITLARVLFRYDIRVKPGDSTGAGGLHLEEGRKDPLEFQVDDVFSILTEGPMVEFNAQK